MIKTSNVHLLPGGGNGKQPVIFFGGAIGRSNFCPSFGIENRGGAIGAVMGAEGN
jgi:hypothetical protein